MATINGKYYGNPAQGRSLEKAMAASKGKDGKDGLLKTKSTDNHEDDVEQPKGEGYTGSKIVVHQKDDGSYETHSTDEFGDTKVADHADMDDVKDHMDTHFGAEDYDGDVDDDAGEEDVVSSKGDGMKSTLKSILG